MNCTHWVAFTSADALDLIQPTCILQLRNETNRIESKQLFISFLHTYKCLFDATVPLVEAKCGETKCQQYACDMVLCFGFLNAWYYAILIVLVSHMDVPFSCSTETSISMAHWIGVKKKTKRNITTLFYSTSLYGNTVAPAFQPFQYACLEFESIAIESGEIRWTQAYTAFISKQCYSPLHSI